MTALGEGVKLDRETRCLACNEILDGASHVGETFNPSPNDITICIYCAHIMAFDNNLLMRELTSEEMYDVAGDKTILAVTAAIAISKRTNKPK